MNKRVGVVIVAVAAAGVLSACSSAGEDTVTSQTATATTAKVETTEVAAEFGPIKDEGLGVTFHFQGTLNGPAGGTQVVVAITNDNESPLDPQSIAEPTLEYNAGDGDWQEAALMTSEGDNNSGTVPLDLPLGAGATTNLKYSFDVTRQALGDARFTLGNVEWSGNLII